MVKLQRKNKMEITLKGRTLKPMKNFSLGHMDARKQQHNVFKG
jgi:hypothetical protein